MEKYTSIRLEITSKCNINCKYCHNADYANKNDDMTYEEVIILLESLRNRFNINKVLITGGEPLLNPRVVDIIQYLTKSEIKSDLVTNGKLLTYDIIERLNLAGLKRIRISIDGIGVEHQKYRIGSDVNDLWKKAKFIKKNTKINTVIHTVSSMHNVKYMFEIYQKIIEIKADRWRVFDVGYEGQALKNIKQLDISQYYEEFMNQMALIIEHYIKNNLMSELDMEINGVFKTSLLTKPTQILNEIDKLNYIKNISGLSPCGYISHQSTIRSNGKGTLCQFFHNVMYDYKKYGYSVDEAIKNKKLYPENLIKFQEIKHCVNCKYAIICNSGCRAKAKYLTGDITNPDPVFCVLLPLLYEKIVPLFPKEKQELFLGFIQDAEAPLYNADDLVQMIRSKY